MFIIRTNDMIHTDISIKCMVAKKYDDMIIEEYERMMSRGYRRAPSSDVGVDSRLYGHTKNI